MKNKTLALMVALAVAISACNDVEFQPEPSPVATTKSPQYEEVTYPNSDAFRVPMSRAGNTFETDWENCHTLTLSTGELVYTPWSGRAEGNFSTRLAADISKSNGWIILAHNFNVDPSYMLGEKGYYMLMYNKLTSALKVFYYHKEAIVPTTTAFWDISFNNSQGWMNAVNEIAIPTGYKFKNESEYIWTTTIEGPERYQNICYGWNVFVVPSIAYDPTALRHGLSIRMSSYGVSSTYLDLFGTSEGSINGTIITDGSTNPFSKLENSLATSGGDAAKSWVEKTLEKSDIASSAVSLLSGGTSALVKAGINLITKIFTAPFSSSTESIQRVELSARIDTKMKGTATLVTQSGAISKQFPIGVTETGVNLGVWNLKDNPTIYIHPVGVLESLPGGSYSDENPYLFRSTGKYKYEIVVNPALSSVIKKSWVECTPVYYSVKNYDESALPQLLVNFTDFGTIGSYDRGDATRVDRAKKIYSDSYDLYKVDMLQTAATYAGLWNRYGKDSGSVPAYKYVYGPKNDDLKRGNPFAFSSKYINMKVSFYMVTELEGKCDTIVNTRTFIPKFEWDPDYVSRYENNTMTFLQEAAAHDSMLSEIDKHIK